MADRNTKIRGNQIRDLTITADDIANDTITGIKLADAVAAAGLIKDGSENLAVGAGDGIDVNADDVAVDVTDLIDTSYGLTEDTNNIRVNIAANDGLEFATGALTVNYDNSTIGIISNALAVKDSGITEAKLNMYNSAATGKFLGYTSNGMEWTDVPTAEVQEADFVGYEVANGTPDGIVTDFTHDTAAVAATVQVYLNGILQQPGSGKDYIYTVGTKTAAFAVAPDTTDIVAFAYLKD
jgi:hypothetical protein